MNKENDNRDRLIADLFDDKWSQGTTADFARQAAAAARRRHATKRMAAFAGTLAVAATVLVVAHLSMQQPTRPISTAAHSSLRPPSYQEISDDELLAALGDRPVLILPDGQKGKHIFLLDQIQEQSEDGIL